MPTTILETIFKRRSVRQFAPRAVEPETIHSLLEAAMAAPNACNSQPWEFIVVTDGEILEKLRSKLLSGRYNAPCAIVVCGNQSIANNSVARFFWVQDCSAAMENLLLAAAGMGLGAVWIGVHPMPALVTAVRTILNMPEAVTPLGIALVGYPAEGAVPRPRTQYDEHRVHWQIYEARKHHPKKKNARLLE